MKRTLQGLVIPKTDRTVVAKARAELTVCPVQLNTPFPKRFKVYVESDTHIGVPTFWKAGFDTPPPPPPPASALLCRTLPFQATLKPELHQPAAAAAILASLSSTGGALLSLPVGYGKTVCALHVAHALKLRCLILVHKEFLAQQWADRIAAFMPGASVTKIQGATCDTSGDFVIAMIQSVCLKAYPPSTFKTMGLLVVDEVHHIAAEMFSKAMFSLALPRVLGLSATPTRRDGLSSVITWFFGPITFQVARTAATNVSVKVLKYSPTAPADMPLNKRGEVCYSSLVSNLVADPARTALIVDAAAHLQLEHHTLVLSHRRAHCQAIAAALVEKGIDAACYIGGGSSTPPPNRVIVSTYALTSEGFDLPRLSALVLATPSSDVTQATGRVLRNPLQSPVIVDVVDAFPIAYAQFAKRKALYKKVDFRLAVPPPAAAPPRPLPAAPTTCLFLDDE